MLEDYDRLDEGSGGCSTLRADENADVLDEDSLFEEEFFEQLDVSITNFKQIERLFSKLESFDGDSLREALFDATGELDGFDENDDFDEDNFDESSIVGIPGWLRIRR